MTEHSMILAPAKVRAFLAGATQHRVPVKDLPDNADIIVCSSLDLDDNGDLWCFFGSTDLPMDPGGYECVAESKSPFGQPGDTVWFKETWNIVADHNDPYSTARLKYKADGALGRNLEFGEASAYLDDKARYKSPVTMPRRFSRISCTVKRVWVEWVQEISDLDAINEGAFTIPTESVRPGYAERVFDCHTMAIKPPIGPGPVERFLWQWEATHGPGNVLVWCAEFEVAK